MKDNNLIHICLQGLSKCLDYSVQSMQTLRLSVIGSLILLSFTTSCKKDESYGPSMPPYTETGAGTFACKVDGKIYVPIDETAEGHEIGGGYSYVTNIVTAQASQNFSDKTKNRKFMLITINDVKDTGMYPLNSESGNDGYYSIDNESNFYTNGKYVGMIHLKKLNKANGIASGTFYFDAIDSTTGKIVHITEGIFDIKAL